jgi:aspartyl-tRNA(Asn)/glutamyl-tRNA(Gln) amidotransferase subunit C
VAISEADVRHIAKLANLALKDDEIVRMTQELGAIVGYVEQLAEVDTEGVEPIAQVTGLVNVTRPDEPGMMFTPKQALTNAPKADSVAFLVPKAVER